jgi:hypothetical protein
MSSRALLLIFYRISHDTIDIVNHTMDRNVSAPAASFMEPHNRLRLLSIVLKFGDRRTHMAFLHSADFDNRSR